MGPGGGRRGPCGGRLPTCLGQSDMSPQPPCLGSWVVKVVKTLLLLLDCSYEAAFVEDKGSWEPPPWSVPGGKVRPGPRVGVRGREVTLVSTVRLGFVSLSEQDLLQSIISSLNRTSIVYFGRYTAEVRDGMHSAEATCSCKCPWQLQST